MKEIKIRKDIRAEIVRKFGTYAKFCRVSGYNYYLMQVLFASKRPSLEQLNDLDKLVSSTRPNASDPVKITSDILNKMRKGIESAGGVRMFCEAHGFNQSNLYRVLKGERKRINVFVRDVLSKLDINPK